MLGIHAEKSCSLARVVELPGCQVAGLPGRRVARLPSYQVAKLELLSRRVAGDAGSPSNQVA